MESNNTTLAVNITNPGGLHSPEDYRDRIAQSVAAMIVVPMQLPDTMDTLLAPAMMQAQIPACVSHSIAEILKTYWHHKTGKWVDFSPRFLDILVKRYDGQDRATGGTYPRMVMKLAMQYGCATTATLPNDTGLPVLEYRDDRKLTKAVFEEAAQYKIPGYVRVDTTFDAMRRGMYNFGVLSTLFSIGQELWVPSWAPKDVDPLRTPIKVVSGHQMTQRGWKDKQFNTLRNSWSTLWGTNGDTKFDPIVWKPYIAECWAIADLPSDLRAFLSQLPAKQDFTYTWKKDLFYGEYNDDIKFAQIALMILGYLESVDPKDLGNFGPKTQAAVLKYQIAKKIFPTLSTTIGPRTREALGNDFSV